MIEAKGIIVFILYFSASLYADPDLSSCEVAAKTEQGYVCGRIKNATNGAEYASFMGIPYAKQPLGELRFKELQPAEPFEGIFNASEPGPICPQVDIFYKPNGLASPKYIGEDCIRINIFVPYKYMPSPNTDNSSSRLLPILFYIHGGSFSYGSGNPEFHGPEYLMTRDMILVTINYRLHVFGFLSMNNEYIPGNNGLRDAITALKWVRNNIKNFGGDPDRVTIGGQSAGGIMSHILSISPAAKGLFKQVWTASGLTISNSFSYMPAYATMLNTLFFIIVGINPLQTPKQIHDDLVAAPIDKILHGNKVLLDLFGLLTFAPVIEKTQPNFTTIIPKDPEDLLSEGFGNEYPLVAGFCNNEAETFRRRFEQINESFKLTMSPQSIIPLNILFSTNILMVPVLTIIHLAKYYNMTLLTLDNHITASNDEQFKYPAQRVTHKRLATGAAKTYLYQFQYQGENSPIKIALDSKFSGAGHIEDVTYFFRLNYFLGPQTVSNELADNNADSKMKYWMTSFISNYVINGSPVENDSNWPPTQSDLKFQDIEKPLVYNFAPPTPYMMDKIAYFTTLYAIGMGK